MWRHSAETRDGTVTNVEDSETVTESMEMGRLYIFMNNNDIFLKYEDVESAPHSNTV